MSGFREGLLKWKLMLTTAPVVGLVLLCRYLLEHFYVVEGKHFSGVMDFGAIAPILTAGVFLIGLMLSGTMTDYKESEKIPAELACTLESMSETIDWAASNKPAIPAADLQKLVVAITEDLLAWLGRRRTQVELFATLATMNSAIRELDKAGATAHASRLLGELTTLRKQVTRIGVISRTGFLASGYALLDTLVSAVLFLLIICSYKQEFGTVGKYVIIGFVALTYVYMWRLIRDLDDPFEYSPDEARNGAAEIELFPLLEYQSRQKGRHEASAGPANSAAQK
jgi:hypothetical protein